MFRARSAARALAVRRAFPHRHAAIVGADGIVPRRAMGGEVRLVEAAAVQAHELRGAGREGSLVEGVPASFGDLAQGGGERREPHSPRRSAEPGRLRAFRRPRAVASASARRRARRSRSPRAPRTPGQPARWRGRADPQAPCGRSARAAPSIRPPCRGPSPMRRRPRPPPACARSRDSAVARCSRRVRPARSHSGPRPRASPRPTPGRTGRLRSPSCKGSTTPSAADVATAASTACPPSISTRSPALGGDRMTGGDDAPPGGDRRAPRPEPGHGRLPPPAPAGGTPSRLRPSLSSLPGASGSGVPAGERATRSSR